MNNVFEFAMGLQAGEFLSKLDAAGGELRSFTGIADAMVAVFNKTGAQFVEISSAWQNIKFRENKDGFAEARVVTEILASGQGKPAGASGETAFSGGLHNFISQTFAGIAKEWRAAGVKGASHAWLKGTLEAGQLAWTVLNPGGNAVAPGDGTSMAPLSAEKSHFQPEFTSLEKMGFIMSGEKVQNPYHQRSLDLLQQIAENTKRPAHTLSVPMPDDKHLRDIVDPSPFISNIV